MKILKMNHRLTNQILFLIVFFFIFLKIEPLPNENDEEINKIVTKSKENNTLILSPIDKIPEENYENKPSEPDSQNTENNEKEPIFEEQNLKPTELIIKPQSPPNMNKSAKYALELTKKYKPNIEDNQKVPKNINPDYLRKTTAVAMKSVKDKEIPEATKKLLKAEQERRENEYTFRPQLIPNQYNEKIENLGIDRIEQLAQPNTAEMYKREKQHENELEKEFAKNCTFRPTLVAKKQESDTLEKEEVEQRLLREAKRHAESIERAIKEKQEKELIGCTFKPKINTEKEAQIKPIYERFNEIQKKRNEKLQKLRQEVESTNNDLRFKPDIKKSQRESEQQPSAVHVTERLMKDAVDRTEKQYRMSEMASQLASKEYPFMPNIVASQKQIVQQDFYTRQLSLQERKREHQAAGLDDPNYTFHPTVNLTSQVLVGADPKRMYETIDDKIKRLAKRDEKREEALKQEIEYENSQVYTYHPEINQKSKILPASKALVAPIEASKDLLNKKEMKKLEIEKKEMQECTFHPTIRNKPNIESHYSNPKKIDEVIKEKAKEKEAKIVQAKLDAEYEKIKECTFKPSVEKPAISQEIPIIAGIFFRILKIIKLGLNRHLELQEKKKKIEQDKKERENEVFGHAQKYNQRLAEGKPHYTIPEPFPLTEKRDENLSRATKEILEKEKSECKFKPQTLEAYFCCIFKKNRAKKKKVQQIIDKKVSEAVLSQI